jgi:hypothetical protein
VCFLVAFDAQWWDGREWAGYVSVWAISILKVAWLGGVWVFVWGALLLALVVMSGRCICRGYVYRSTFLMC